MMLVDKSQFDAVIQHAEYSWYQEREGYTRILYYDEGGTRIAEMTTWRETGETEYGIADAPSIGRDDLE